MENATSDDSVAIDEDLVAALGFEPAADILIVDDAEKDALSISTDDIEVSTDALELKADTKSAAPLAPGPPTHKNNRNKSKNKDKPKIQKAKPIKLEDKLAAESKAETKTDDKAETKADAKEEAKSETKAKPKSETKVPPPVKKAEAKPKAESPESKEPSEPKEKGDDKQPPPPTAADAFLISEQAPPDYSFSDLEMPNFAAALAWFTRSDAAQEVAEPAPDTTSPVADATPPVADSSTVIDARVTGAPAVVTTPPVTAPPATAPPQIVEAPAEPNVYVAPKRSGRTRIRSRKVRRQIRHIDPWSVLTFSVIFHACVFGALLLSSVLVWQFADGAGFIERTETLWAELADKPDFQIDEDVLVRAAVMIAGLLTIASSVLLVLLTVFFNLISDLVGGIRVTVIEEEPVRSIK